MNDGVHIRAFILADYSAAVALWSSVDGLGLNESDTPEAIAAFLQRNPGLSAAAVDADGTLIGAILCGHNGRAGSITHLAVASAHRGKRVGSRLVEYAFSKLSEARIPRCNIFVYNDNQGGNDFWLKSGWVDPRTWRVLQKHVRTEPAVMTDGPATLSNRDAQGHD